MRNVISSNPATLSPFVFPYNNKNIIWDAGIAPSFTGWGTSPVVNESIIESTIAIIPASAVVNAPGGVLDIVQYLGNGPIKFPYGAARVLNISVNTYAATDWSSYNIAADYKNAYGWDLSVPATAMLAQQTSGSVNALARIGIPFPSGTTVSDRFFYAQEITSLRLEYNTGTQPADDLYINIASQGMSIINLQDSTRFNSGSLQVLAPTNAGSVVTNYSAYMDNYPSMVMEQPVWGPLFKPEHPNAFLNNSAGPVVGGQNSNFYGETNGFASTIAAGVLPFPIAQLNGMSGDTFKLQLDIIAGAQYMTSQTTSQIARIPYAVGNVRVEVGSTNNTKLLISLIQNGISN